MEKLIRKGVLGLFAFFAVLMLKPHNTLAAPGIGVSFQVFYDNLEPYGRWVNDRQYGYMWIPQAERDFQPYASRGHWIQTGYGNTWVSDYAWGWAPFHYGRWVYDDYYGWAWLPGDEWGPGWVDWRSGGGYYGWTPMGPSINVSINIPLARWIFVPQRYICSPDIYNYRVYGDRGGVIYRNTTIINNYYTVNNRRYAAGPRFDEIQRVTNRPVRVYNVHDGDRPGRVDMNRGDVNFYRPSVGRNANDRGPSRLAEARPQGRETDNRSNNYGRNDDRTSSRGNNDRDQGINWQMGRSSQAAGNDQRQGRTDDRDAGDRGVSQPGRNDDSRDRPSREQQQREAAVRQEQQSRELINQQRERAEQQAATVRQEQQTREQQSREAMNQQRERAEQQAAARRQTEIAEQRSRQQAQPQPRQQPERSRAAESQPRQQENRGSQGNSGRPQRVG